MMPVADHTVWSSKIGQKIETTTTTHYFRSSQL